MVSFEIDARRQFVSIRVMGLLSAEDASGYVATVSAEFVRKIGLRPYVMMIDTTQCGLQSQSVVQVLAPHIAAFPKATRIALVNGESLARMQLKRVLTRDYAQFFDSVAEALPWLLADWPPVRSASPPTDRTARPGSPPAGSARDASIPPH